MNKHYIVYYLKSSTDEDFFFKEFSKNVPLFTTDLDLAINFNNLNDQEIDHYATNITKNLWKSSFSNIKEKGIAEIEYSVKISKKEYNNEKCDIFNAIKKLTKEEIKLLNLEETAFLFELSKEDNDSDNSIIWQFANGNFITGAININNNNTTIEDKILEIIKKEIKQ